jgi:uncharacterized protein (DUF1501 family)
MRKISVEQWIGWIVATATAALAMAAFAFDKFETQDHAREVKTDLTERLNRMEAKLDNIGQAVGARKL